MNCVLAIFVGTIRLNFAGMLVMNTNTSLEGEFSFVTSDRA